MTALPHDTVSALWRVQGGRCFHCGDPMAIVGTQRPDRWSREHLDPATGAMRRSKVYVLACRGCNTRRGDRPLTPEERRRAMAIIIAARALFPALCEESLRGNQRKRRPGHPRYRILAEPIGRGILAEKLLAAQAAG